MTKPRYQDYQAGDIPAAESKGASVRVMAGESGGVTGPVKMKNPGLLLDVRLQPGARWAQVGGAAEWWDERASPGSLVVLLLQQEARWAQVGRVAVLGVMGVEPGLP